MSHENDAFHTTLRRDMEKWYGKCVVWSFAVSKLWRNISGQGSTGRPEMVCPMH